MQKMGHTKSGRDLEVISVITIGEHQLLEHTLHLLSIFVFVTAIAVLALVIF